MAQADSWMNPVPRRMDAASIVARIKFVEDLLYKWQTGGTRALEVCYWYGRSGGTLNGRVKAIGRLSRGFVPAVLALFALANWVLGLRKVVCLLMSGLGA
jgi:hypothetical protein